MAAYYTPQSTLDFGSYEQGNNTYYAEVTITNTGDAAGFGAITDTSPFHQSAGYIILDPGNSVAATIRVDTSSLGPGVHEVDMPWWWDDSGPDWTTGDPIHCKITITSAESPSPEPDSPSPSLSLSPSVSLSPSPSASPSFSSSPSPSASPSFSPSPSHSPSPSPSLSPSPSPDPPPFAPEGGTWTITVNGETTGAIPYNATYEEVQAALLALPSLAAGLAVEPADQWPINGGQFIVDYALGVGDVSSPIVNTYFTGNPTTVVTPFVLWDYHAPNESERHTFTMTWENSSQSPSSSPSPSQSLSPSPSTSLSFSPSPSPSPSTSLSPSPSTSLSPSISLSPSPSISLSPSPSHSLSPSPSHSPSPSPSRGAPVESGLGNTLVFLEDLFARRNYPGIGFNCPTLLVRLAGGQMVDMIAYEPDPLTHRSNYYYNTRLNALYRLIQTGTSTNRSAYWKKVSQ